MYKIIDINDKKNFFNVDRFNDAVNKAIEFADEIKGGVEIKEKRGNRWYFIMGVTEFPSIRFIR